ncbi:MAG: hypothetical protein A2081_04315 [Elusimicrobia bacterium GWC2_61_19]|nr:MAG: hypothetical protein A2081_04315 [Elusimicrobia bacterium GWC2_61_19]
MKQLTILIVDDEPIWLKLLYRLFTGSGYQVLVSPSRACAIETVRSNRPDCVVLDFNLSDGDAVPVCAAIRACEERRIPIIIFSSDPAAEGCVGTEHGADRFLPKTTPLKELLAEVIKLLTVHG